MQLAKKGDADILRVANPIMDRLMEGSKRIDHALHVTDFTDRLKSIVTAESLDRMCRQYQSEIGFFSHREPVAVFRREGSVAIVWRQYATRSDDEFVASIVLVERDGRYLVDHALVY